jgi:hypothetical protein
MDGSPLSSIGLPVDLSPGLVMCALLNLGSLEHPCFGFLLAHHHPFLPTAG